MARWEIASDSLHASANKSQDLKLRIGAIFILLVTSAFGALLPILAKRYYVSQGKGKLEKSFAPIFFDFTKYLGSGIIISTAFVHLLSPAFEELKDPALPEAWLAYDWAPVLAMTAVFFIFTVELLAFRIGTGWLKRLGVEYDSHGRTHTSHGPCDEDAEEHAAPEDDHHFLDGDGSADARPISEEETLRAPFLPKTKSSVSSDARPKGSGRRSSSRRKLIYGSIGDGQNVRGRQAAQQERTASAESAQAGEMPNKVASQIIGVAVLEFGVLLHSFVIGMTLAVVERFPTLCVVITLHQMFEGLGLGARLANLSLPKRMQWVPLTAGVLYACITPAGLAIGLCVRKAYSPESPTALIVSGVLDALSAGVLLYTGLVELLCAEFLFHQEMREAPLGRVMYALSCVFLGAIIMAVLGIWA